METEEARVCGARDLLKKGDYVGVYYVAQEALENEAADPALLYWAVLGLARRGATSQAIATRRNIVPILIDGFGYPPRKSLPVDVDDLINHNGAATLMNIFRPPATNWWAFLKSVRLLLEAKGERFLRHAPQLLNAGQSLSHPSCILPSGRGGILI